ncbi:MAG: DUF2892 domain-containing protein [Longimicrobiales bacterium]|nr:DUF2892 domain-containing protein [Longimicrobiales bacterium]
MNVNEGTADRVLRVVLGSTLLWLGLATDVLPSAAGVAAWIVGGVLLLTGVTGFCGLYKVLGISTCPRRQG